MYDEKFLKEFEEGKVKQWKDNYLNYIGLSNHIKNILEICKNNNIERETVENEEENENEIDNNKKIELNNSKLKNSIQNNIIKEDKKEKLVDNIDDIDDRISIKIEGAIDNKYKKATKNFINLLDKEIKNIHIFYINKETTLFEGINTQISGFNSLNNDENDKKAKIINELQYLSKFAKYLINYVYYNIRALKNILYSFDNQIMFISYNYMKKHLTKNNGDLVYILNFKILDESIIAIQELFSLIEKDLNKTNFLKDNKEMKEKLDEENAQILENIENIEELYEKIFEEFEDWEKYLNMGLSLPSSSNNSIFVNTSFIADSIFPLSEKGKINSKKYSKNLKAIQIEKESINKNKIDNLNDIDNFNNGKKIVKAKPNNEEEKDENQLGFFNIDEDFESYELFTKSEVFSFKTKNVLTKGNLNNLNLLIPILSLYSLSVSYLIPKIIILIIEIFEDSNNKIYLYGLIISFPAIGNIFAKFIIKNFINKSFKIILSICSFFLICYYILLLLGIFFQNIYLIAISRFILGFCIVKHLTKIYIAHFVPISNQIKVSQKFYIYINIFFCIGLLLNSFDYFDWIKHYYFNFLDEEINIFKMVLIVSGLSSLILFIFIIINFHEPTKYSLLRQTLIDIKSRHRLSKAFILYNKQKENNDKIDRDYSDANKNSNLSKPNELFSFVRKYTKKYYYTIIKSILILFLISSEYSKENLLLYIPRLISFNIYINLKKKKFSNYYLNKYIIIFGPIISSFCFFISYFIKRLNLKGKILKKNKTKILMSILFILILLNVSFIILTNKINDIKWRLVYIPSILIFIMIILIEIYRIIFVNLFIKLLPSNKIKFCCCKISDSINFITKLIKIIPSLIIILFYFLNKDEFNKKILLTDIIDDKDNNYNFILFIIQTMIFIFCLIICLFNRSNLKSSSFNRLLSQENIETI